MPILRMYVTLHKYIVKNSRYMFREISDIIEISDTMEILARFQIKFHLTIFNGIQVRNATNSF